MINWAQNTFNPEEPRDLSESEVPREPAAFYSPVDLIQARERAFPASLPWELEPVIGDEPKQIRSIHAKFDQEKTESAKLTDSADWTQDAFYLVDEPRDEPLLTVAAGIAYFTPEGEFLFLRRSENSADHQGEWAFPGGGVEGDESPAQAACRESGEEIGVVPKEQLGYPLVINLPDNEIEFHTFFYKISHKFNPILNEEHDGFMWATPEEAPQPAHSGVQAMLGGLPEKNKEWTQDAFNPDEPRDESGKWAEGETHEFRLHELSSNSLAKEIDKSSERHSKANQALIDAGRGSEKVQETLHKAAQGNDRLAIEFKKAWNEYYALVNHREERKRLGEKYVRARGKRVLEERKNNLIEDAFDPDEPRDESGKWTEEGGGEVTSSKWLKNDEVSSRIHRGLDVSPSKSHDGRLSLDAATAPGANGIRRGAACGSPIRDDPAPGGPHYRDDR